MAEHGAHLSSNGFSEEGVPNIFEVLAQQSLAQTLHPALGHAVKVFAEKFPEKLGVILQYYDEIFLLLDSLIQSYYLRKHNGSFAENFYSLKRVSSRCRSSQLSKKLKLRVLACLVLIPYIKQKLQAKFEQLQYQYGDAGRFMFLQKQINVHQRMKGLFMFIFPYISSTWELLNLGYQLKFMLGQGRWHSPSMHLSGTELRYLGIEDDLQPSVQGPSWSQLSINGKLLHTLKASLNVGSVALSTGLQVSVFFLQFLDWWYASDASATSLTALPIPEPPKSDDLKDVSCSSCPLCQRLRVNSTALSVSGYVFCYVCIHEHIKRHRCCPVTGHVATEDHLVKIYEQNL